MHDGSYRCERPSAAILKKYVPNQHGVWFMLILPYLLGMAAVHISDCLIFLTIDISRKAKKRTPIQEPASLYCDAATLRSCRDSRPPEERWDIH
ncbi:YwiC-like family protein [Paenibacillus sp. P32E]|uniref:YwiC-like family protein n=1 Tax=Paenibacillus sp. P32E TaxID=1349434 RepID=UPI003531828E